MLVLRDKKIKTEKTLVLTKKNGEVWESGASVMKYPNDFGQSIRGIMLFFDRSIFL